MYTILLYKQFLNTNNKIKFIEEYQHNNEFMDLLYCHTFKYGKISFPKLNLPLLQKNTIDKFTNLALSARFNYINWIEFFKTCDIHSYEIYKEILTKQLRIKTDLLPYFKIRTFKNAKNILTGKIECHNKGKKVAIIKHKNDVIYTNGDKYYHSDAIKNTMLKAFSHLENVTLYGFLNKRKISLYDIETDASQLDRAFIIAQIYYQYEKDMQFVFELPYILSSGGNPTAVGNAEDTDKIYLVKSESKSKYLIKIN